MADQLARTDATGLAELIRSDEISPVELLDDTIERIERLNPAVNAVIHTSYDKAHDTAASPDLPDGPFRGVPFLLKDLWPTSAGDPFHLGIKAFKEAGYRHPTDSNLVTAYRRAGFVLAGRTNTPEMGLVATTEPLAYGPTRNPWNRDLGSGGSSGGAAAAVSAGMVPAANASDGGGSIRIPAAMCGLVGLKPSRGRMSMGPMQEEWGLSCQHVVSHSVRDTAGILDATAYPFPGDGVIAPAPTRPYIALLDDPPQKLRIGLMAEALSVPTNDACRSAAESAAELLRGLGHEVRDAHPSALERTTELGDAFSAQWAVNCRANLVGLGELLGRPLTADDVEPGTWALQEMGAAVDATDYARSQSLQGGLRREMASWWEDGWDLLLTPTTAEPPPEIGYLAASYDDPFQAMMRSIPWAVFTSVFNVTGHPGISLPLSKTPEGLPVGVQLVAAYGREDLLIGIAAQLEREVCWADERAPMHP